MLTVKNEMVLERVNVNLNSLEIPTLVVDQNALQTKTVPRTGPVLTKNVKTLVPVYAVEMLIVM